MGKWVPRLNTRRAYPTIHAAYVKITRVLRQRNTRVRAKVSDRVLQMFKKTLFFQHTNDRPPHLQI